MQEAAQKIVVFGSYDNVVLANIVKTKLDAYGIPCFLTNENFTALYPIANDIFPGVRIHVFDGDLEQAKEVMIEEAPRDALRCPHCSSTRVEHGLKTDFRTLAIAFLALVFMIFARSKTRTLFRCRDCAREFEISD